MTKVLLLTCPDIYQHWDKRFIVGPWLGDRSLLVIV